MLLGLGSPSMAGEQPWHCGFIWDHMEDVWDVSILAAAFTLLTTFACLCLCNFLYLLLGWSQGLWVVQNFAYTGQKRAASGGPQPTCGYQAVTGLHCEATSEPARPPPRAGTVNSLPAQRVECSSESAPFTNTKDFTNYSFICLFVY